MALSSKEILFDKFEVIECLKKDDHSSVYLATHIYLGKRIILKALNTETISDNAKIERFKREAKTMAKLDHPNIIKVLDFGMYKEFFYISFEYFEGHNLRTVINDKSLSIENKTALAVQLLQGLAYAHQNQIIHRDIKPENILVNSENSLKIGDFGLALTINDNFVTNQYAIVGTPCYMSPEQVQGKKLTIQSDLFSAGIVILELFTNVNPFLGDDVNKTISNVINYNEDRLKKYNEMLPKEISSMVLKLLRKDINNRIQSAEAALGMLDISLIKPVKEQKQLFIRSRKLLIGSLVLVLLAAALVLFFNNKKEYQTEIEPVPVDGKAVVNNSETATNVKDAENGNIIKPSNETGEEKDLKNSDIEIAPEELNKRDENIPANKATENNLSSAQINENSVRFGDLYVECSPWAHIYIDDKMVDTTPLSSPINLKTGVYNIKFVHPNYPEYNELIRIDANKTTEVKINLDELFGYLSCKVFPWGDVYVDDKYIGQTPFSSPVKIFPGSHKLTIKNPNFSDYNDDIEITKEKTFFININLTELSKKDQSTDQN